MYTIDNNCLFKLHLSVLFMFVTSILSSEITFGALSVVTVNVVTKFFVLYSRDARRGGPGAAVA